MMNADQVEHWLKVIEVALIASVKFLLAPFEAERYEFSFWQSFAITTIGGTVGIFVFYYAGSKVSTWWRHIMALIKSVFLRRPAEVIEQKPKKVFTRNKRFVIRIKMKFGLIGIALITPSLISIPIGSIVAANFYRKKRGVLLYLVGSLIFWSFLLNGIAQYLKLSQYIPHP